MMSWVCSDYRLIDAENRTGIDFSNPAAHDDFLPREIHLLKDRPVRFSIRALDVIHSFYLPHFRAQMYAIPGMATTFLVRAHENYSRDEGRAGRPDV